MYRRERGAKGEAARLACGQPEDQRLVGKAGEVFARKGHSVLRVTQRGDSRGNIEIAGVSGGRPVSLEIEVQIAQRLIAGLRASAPVAANDFGRFGVF